MTENVVNEGRVGKFLANLGLDEALGVEYSIPSYRQAAKVRNCQVCGKLHTASSAACDKCFNG